MKKRKLNSKNPKYYPSPVDVVKENKVLKPQLDIFKLGLNVQRVKSKKKGATGI